MSPTPRELVERFYGIVWNQADEAEARRILDAGFRFRGSLGPELRGPDGFISYHRAVHAALENFTCIVDELIETPDRAAARLSFHGRHRAGFFGVAPTGKEIRWSGAAFFSVAKGKITELWVLGDVEAVRRQLAPDSPAESFSV
jgi:predicted ester cyclase